MILLYIYSLFGEILLIGMSSQLLNYYYHHILSFIFYLVG